MYPLPLIGEILKNFEISLHNWKKAGIQKLRFWRKVSKAVRVLHDSNKTLYRPGKMFQINVDEGNGNYNQGWIFDPEEAPAENLALYIWQNETTNKIFRKILNRNIRNWVHSKLAWWTYFFVFWTHFPKQFLHSEKKIWLVFENELTPYAFPKREDKGSFLRGEKIRIKNVKFSEVVVVIHRNQSF